MAHYRRRHKPVGRPEAIVTVLIILSLPSIIAAIFLLALLWQLLGRTT